MKWGRNPSHQIRRIVAILFLLAAVLSAQTAQSPKADPLEQALKRYIRNPEAADMFRKAVAYLPENPPVKSNYKEQLAQAIERAAVAKRDGGFVDQDLEVNSILGRALTASWQLNMSNPRIREEMQAISLRITALSPSPASVQDTFLWKAIDETAAPASTDSQPPSASDANAASQPDLLQQALGGVNPQLQSQARQALSRMDPEVRQALVQIVNENGRIFLTNPVSFATTVLTGLAAELRLPPGSPSAGGGLQGTTDVIKLAAAHTRSVDSVARWVNVITRHSSSYVDVDWKAALAQYNRDQKSPYLEANLQKMLAEALRSSISLK